MTPQEAQQYIVSIDKESKNNNYITYGTFASIIILIIISFVIGVKILKYISILILVIFIYLNIPSGDSPSKWSQILNKSNKA